MAEQKAPSSPVYEVRWDPLRDVGFDPRHKALTELPVLLQDAVSYEAGSAYKSSSPSYPAAREPEAGYKAAQPDYQEAVSQQEAEYEPETVYEVAGAADHYQAGLCLMANPLEKGIFPCASA